MSRIFTDTEIEIYIALGSDEILFKQARLRLAEGVPLSPELFRWFDNILDTVEIKPTPTRGSIDRLSRNFRLALKYKIAFNQPRERGERTHIPHEVGEEEGVSADVVYAAWRMLREFVEFYENRNGQLTEYPEPAVLRDTLAAFLSGFAEDLERKVRMKASELDQESEQDD